MTNVESKRSYQYDRRRSIAHQATHEALLNADFKKEKLKSSREQLKEVLEERALHKINDGGIELISEENNQGTRSINIVLSSSGALEPFIGAVLSINVLHEVHITHLETRKKSTGWDIFVECEATKNQLIAAINALTKHNADLTGIALYPKDTLKQELWFPRHISELDKCSNCLTKYDPVSDPRHPGYQDEAYIARRNFLNSIASGYKYGEPIPIVEYTDEEHAIWKSVYNHLSTLRESYTCLAYRRNLRMLEDEGILSPEKIPQIRDVNEFLQKKTGFVLRPCAGLLSARDFLTSLAFRVFQTTMYVRHSAKPHHSPEPDLIHELLGHVPMFADPMVAQLSQEIGLMSLGASDEEIEKLATWLCFYIPNDVESIAKLETSGRTFRLPHKVYWFIIEFGLCKEDGQLKAIGAGLVSAYGELLHACSDSPEHRDFDPALTAVQKYEDSDYQPVYFVAHSIKDALVKLSEEFFPIEATVVVLLTTDRMKITSVFDQIDRIIDIDLLDSEESNSAEINYALTLDRDFVTMYDPFTRSIEVIRHISQLAPAYERLHADIGATTLVNEKLSMKAF